ncbi:MAG: hypothetical protein F6K42_26635, partial [Leptolyngbya sp. SIO1D8]|nr:hypothetical protein [Leptolyngbya sp. SIO1D8]
DCQVIVGYVHPPTEELAKKTLALTGIQNFITVKGLEGSSDLPRARVTREPRVVLSEFGVELDDSVEIRIWDTSAQIRWWVLPMRPPGTDDMSEEALAELLTPEAMMGVATVKV